MLRLIAKFLIFLGIIFKMNCVLSITFSSQLLTSYNTLAPTVTYYINYTIAGGSLSANSYTSLVFTGKYSITAGTLANCKASTSSAIAPTAITCSVIHNTGGSQTYEVKLTGMFTSAGTYTFLSLKFDIDNPYAQLTQTIGTNIYSSTNSLLAIGSAFVTYVASKMSPCSISSSTQVTGSSSTQTFSFTPTRKMMANSYLLIKMPIWSGTTSNKVSDFLTCSGISGSDSPSLPCNIQTVSSEETINVTEFIKSDRTSLSQIQISIATLKNPWSFYPFGPINFELMIGQDLTQVCRNNYHTVSQPNGFTTLSFLIATQTISTINTGVRLIFVDVNPFPKTGNNRVKLQFPSSISMTYVGSSIVNSFTTTSITMTNISSISLSSFTLTTPPSSRAYEITISTYHVVSGVSYQIDQDKISYQNSPGVFTSLSVIPANLFVNQITTYTIKFTLANKLILGSFINIVFPSDIVMQVGTSTCSINPTGHSCSIISSGNMTITVGSTINSGTSMTVIITLVKNANEAKTTGSFKFYSYYDLLYDSLVDKVDTGLNVTMTAKVLVSGVVTPTSLITYEINSYTFTVVLSDPIPTGGSIEIVFPTSTSPENSALLSASFSTGSCSVTESVVNTLQITNCFTSEMTNLNVNMVISNVRNPPSLKPTSTFKIYFKGLISIINYMDSGIIATMTTATNIASVTLTPSSLIVHETAIYALKIDQKIDTHQLGDYIILQFPSLMTLPATPTCGVVSGPTMLCSRLSNNQLKITYNSAPSSVSLQVNINNIVNYVIGDESVIFTLNIFNSQNFLMEKHDNYPLTYQQSLLTTIVSNNDDNIALGQASNVTLTVTNGFSLYSSLDSTKTKMVIIAPTSFGVSGSCVSTQGTCIVVPAQNKYQVTSIGLTLTNVNITFQGITLNYFNPISDSFEMIYTFNNFNVSYKNSGVTISPYCTSPCQRCDGTKIACESCLPAPNTLIYYDPVLFQCKSSCIDGKYPDIKNQCTLCVSPCLHCLDVENCTKCVSGTWLHLQRCVSICPPTFYNDSTGICLACQDPCQQCNTLTSCKTCTTLYITTDKCVLPENCPTKTFPNSISKACQSCTLPCNQCDITTTNCTTCQTGYLYYDNKCVTNCPIDMYPSGIYCFNCVSPCASCSSATICKTCAIGYLSSGLCVDAEDCPGGTYANSTQLKCRTCPTGCTACVNSTNCSSCDTRIYFFYNFQCITSCPLGTYKSGVTCLPCQSPCTTCANSPTTCLSCQSPKLFYQGSCQDSCPPGSYSDISVCRKCPTICQTCTTGTTCDTCTGNLYFQSNSCISKCPAGFYGEPADNTCTPCQAPCSECSASATNCSKCVAPQLQYLNSCVSQCPGIYFEVNGSCKTCPNCVSCLDATTCLQCNPSFYQFNGVCYTTCPSNAPIKDQTANSCGSCQEDCFSCEGTAKNCTSCYSDRFLYKGSCLVDCPLGFIQDLSKGICTEPLIGSVIYFPFTALFLFFFIVVIVSKCMFSQTETITALGATISLCQFGSWAVLTFILTVDYTLSATLIAVGMYVGLTILVISLGVGITYNIIFYKQYECDLGLTVWKKYDKSCVYAYRVIVVFSIISFRFFRFLYSRLFNRTYLSVYIANGGSFLSTMRKLTIASLLLMTLPMMGIAAFLLYNKQIYDQTFFAALDTVFLSFITICLLTIDSFLKEQDFFEDLRNSMPFMKYRNMLNDQSFQESLLSRDDLDDEPKRKTRSQIGNQKDKDDVFRKVTFIDNNKFGHMNVLEEDDKDQTKSLPENNKINQYPQYDPYNRSEGDRVIDDLFFLENQKKQQERLEAQRLKQLERLNELQRRRMLDKLEEDEEAQRRRLQAEEQQRRRLEEQQQQRRRLEEQQRKRKLREEDQDQRVNLQFPDLIAIDKAEGNKKDRKNPLQLLSKSKKMDDKLVSDKALKKLEQMGKKNGIDPNFMKETFGVQKNHNPELLNQIIDKHHHVKRESVKQLFNENSNPQILQELFNKNSNMDPDKLRDIMNDPNSAILISNLIDKQNGRLSPEMAKQLLDKDSKYNKQFTKNLLSNDNGMDPDKLKSLLKDANGKGKDSPLKALKKIGGQNLQNKNILNNMLGEDAVLDPQNFSRVANDLSIKGISNLFQNKSKNSDLITKKILNNKKINLKNLAPIFQDEQLLEQLAECLGDDNPHLQENLINLFKNADDIDPEKLKQMLADPTIRKKLLSNPVDPDFLAAILSKDSKSDINLLSKTLEGMTEEMIAETFKFDHQSNVDFKNLAALFDKNPKTDPKLVSKMLQPDMVKQVYCKGNDTKMLNKLVEKGNQFDPQVIKGVYGRQKNQFFDTHTDNLMSFDDEKKQDFRSQKDYSLGFQKQHKSQINMSRTAGGMMSFLTPIVPKVNKKKSKNEDEWSSDTGQESIDDGQIKQDQFEDIERRRKKPRLKKLKKKPTDIRLAAQQIYLQRIQAPHQHAVRKASIRKKKKKSNVPGIMDEDNDIFDMDF